MAKSSPELLAGEARRETRFNYFRNAEPYGFTWSDSIEGAALVLGATILTQDHKLKAAILRHNGRLLAVTW